MEASVRQDLEDTAEENAQSDWEYALLTILLDNSEYEIQDADVDAYTDQMLSEYESYATAMGVDLDTLLQTYFGTTEDEMRLLYHDSAVFRVKMTLTFHDIAELEGMEISQEEYDEYTAGLAEQYGYDDGEAFEAAYSEELIREQLIQEKVLDFLCENAKTE
jgi:trigger factor